MLKTQNFWKFSKILKNGQSTGGDLPKSWFSPISTLNCNKKCYRWARNSFQMSKSTHFDPRNSFLGSKLVSYKGKVTIQANFAKYDQFNPSSV